MRHTKSHRSVRTTASARAWCEKMPDVRRRQAMKGTKYFMVVPLIEVRHFDMVVKADLGFGHKNPGILRGVELENKHGFDSFDSYGTG